MEILLVAALVVCCTVLAAPLMLFTYIWLLPFYVVIAFFLWIAGCIHAMIDMKKDNITWRVLRILLYTVIFTLVLAFSLDGLKIEMDETFILICPFLSLISIYLSGKLIDKIYQTKIKQVKFQEFQHFIITIYAERKNGIEKLWEQCNYNGGEDRSTFRVLKLLDICGQPDISELYSEQCRKAISERLPEISQQGKAYGLNINHKEMSMGEIQETILLAEAQCEKELGLIKGKTIDDYKEIKSKYWQLKRSMEKVI